MLAKLLTPAMAEYYAFQAALCFSVAHIFVRRGLVGSNALTGSVISLGTSAVIFWVLVIFFVPFSLLWTAEIGYFMAAGFFAPAIGQTLGYIGMERIGVARSSPIVNTSPIFSSTLAVLFLGEVWATQNILGTCLVIFGVIILSSSRPAKGDWNKRDMIYPVFGALAFGISTTLRKSGLMTVNVPLLAAAVTVGTAFLVLLGSVWWQGGCGILKFHRRSRAWLFGGALINTGAILSFFSALNVGRIVHVEPLVACNPLLTMIWAAIFHRQIETLSTQVAIGALFTVAGTVLVVTAK
ncbi:MAG TPA: DMT family transporter [Acidobacteriota bacterium]|nr:DMT family transporter [Acidobacteriota bacterium]